MSHLDREFRIAPYGSGKLVECRERDGVWGAHSWFRDPEKAKSALERIEGLKEERENATDPGLSD